MENLNNSNELVNEVIDSNENQLNMAILEVLNESSKVLEMAENSTDLSPETLKKVDTLKRIQSMFPNLKVHSN